MTSPRPADVEALFTASVGRRRFLKSSAGGLVLLGLGHLLPAGCTRYPRPEPKLRFFTAKEYAIVNLLAVRLLGVDAVDGVPEAVDVGAKVDELVAGWQADLQIQLRIALRVMEHGTYLFELQRKRFTKLGAEAQGRYLEGWAKSTLGARRMIFRGLKALVAAGYYETAWEGLGYEGPWLSRVDAQPRLEHEPAVSARSLKR